MNFNEAMDYIENTTKFGMNLGLQRINKLLEYMGNPEKELKCIHIAGTNGKGSITTMISDILAECGYRVGVYTSPYLQRFSERIRINEAEITNEDIARLTTEIAPIVDRIISEGLEHPTEFEIITAMMFKYFKEKNVDYAVLEVGLGGRLDSTNVINPVLAVITSIDFDHMSVLGNTLGEIAGEKAGIIKENGTVVIYPQQKEAHDVIKKTCIDKNARLIEVKEEGINLKSYSMDGQVFDTEFEDETLKDIHINLLGEYQLLNAKTAIASAKALQELGINISKECIYNGLRKSKWPGRLEVMKKSPIILLDGAHNLQGIKSLEKAVRKYFDYKRLIAVMGILSDKQVEDMCEVFMPLADVIVTVTPDSDRALPAEELSKIARKYCDTVITGESIEAAFKKVMAMAQPDDMVVFCGSLYMIGHVRTLVENFR
ncbi:folylpolyglutamate synthase [Oxobacter pfennigii]|uniref:Dihydrofolate synthase/folylpolyglutamate synthase n=1 Tax=Oxobacter pfennigii TaxID=36849 RepID=A0A0N8NSJ7_9CLOT|nr:folylpolyglutamate synthase/dihydrofolate synthase family protein [Oxobacter pfennigii]KPU42224.1 folylpolyglutamate synthase [Oxobacter pfennigii]